MLRISEGCRNSTMVVHVIRVRAITQPLSFNLRISCGFTYKSKHNVSSFFMCLGKSSILSEYKYSLFN